MIQDGTYTTTEIVPLPTQSLATLTYKTLDPQLEERFDELTSLREGWDGYNGIAVNFSVANYARELLFCLRQYNADNGFSIIPVASGGIQLEWHTLKGDLELFIQTPTEVEVFFEKVGDSAIELLIRDGNFQKVSTWLSSIADPPAQVLEAA